MLCRSIPDKRLQPAMKLLCLAALMGVTVANSGGAPASSCEDMLPQHRVDPGDGGQERYIIIVTDNDDDSYTSN